MPAEQGLLPAVLVEAFTSTPFAGNGAAVVLLAEPQPTPWLQALARSLRQSETAFLLEAPQGLLLRWFTPTCEVPLCGHATLAALLALGHWGRLQSGQLTSFLSRSGPLEVGLDPQRQGWGSLVLPSSGLLEAPVPSDLAGLVDARGLGSLEAFWTSPLGYSVGLLPPWAALEALTCPAAELQGALRQGLVLMQGLQEGHANQRAQIGGEMADYQLRFFAPGLGIDEDPVTGSAHALVAPWWQQRLGKGRVVGWQCSDRPGGMVCEAASSGMIRLTGSGHLLWDGTLRTASSGWEGGSAEASAGATAGLAAAWSDWRTAIPFGWSTPSAATPS
jgi:PhzF family phenazine biosynthesis protein